MKDPGSRTKVVLRHLPPSIPERAVMDQIDVRFAGRYDWACFCPGKSGHKNQRSSRLYLNFKNIDDVVEFAEAFNGHMFVNEKGTQFKAMVEYAPMQRVPKLNVKRDGREGTIFKDNEYLEFLELISKPAENLPSAEIQLERKEAERAATGKETPVVTPLMLFIRQKRAAKSVQRLSGSRRQGSKAAGISGGSSNPSQRAPEKRRASQSMYFQRNGSKDGNLKEKPAQILLSRREDRKLKDKYSTGASVSASGDMLEDGTSMPNAGMPGSSVPGAAGNNKIVLLKAKGREDPHDQRANVRVIRNVLGRDGHHGESSIAAIKSDELQASNIQKEKALHELANALPNSINQLAENDAKDYLGDKHAVAASQRLIPPGEKVDKSTRNRDRPDRGFWAPRRSDRFSANSGNYSSSSESPLVVLDSGDSGSLSQRTSGEKKADGHGVYRGGPAENGSHKQAARRGQPPRGPPKDAESNVGYSEGKFPRKGSSAYGAQEKQIWVQKAGSAT